MANMLRQLTGFILALIAIPLLALSSCDRAAEQVLFDANTYKTAFENQNLYENLIPILLPALLDSGEFTEADIGSPVSFEELNDVLTEEEWQQIAELLVPKSWLQSQFEQSIDALASIIEGDFDVLDRQVELSELRDRFTGEPADEAARLIFQSAPPCTPQQSLQVRAINNNRDVMLPVCQPPRLLQDVSVAIMTDWFSQIGRQLPDDTITIRELANITEDNAEAIFLIADLNNQLLVLMLLCPLSIVALIVTISVRSLKEFGRWLSGICLVSGLVVLISIVPLQGFILENYSSIGDATGTLERFQAQIVAGLSRSVLSSMSNYLLIEVGIYIALAFVFFVITTFAPSPVQQAQLLTTTASDQGNQSKPGQSSSQTSKSR